MNEDEIRDSVLAAIESSAEPLSQILRESAYGEGWDAESARSLSIEIKGTAMTATSPLKKAADLEYGSDERRPNPAVRRFINRKGVIEYTILKQAEDRLQGVW